MAQCLQTAPLGPAQQHQWTDALGKPVECIHRFSCQVVGLCHTNKYIRDRMGFVNDLTRGTKLVLVQEPDNLYDRKAILVYVEGELENDLGSYIAKLETEVRDSAKEIEFEKAAKPREQVKELRTAPKSSY